VLSQRAIPRRRALSATVLVLGLGAVAASALWLLVTGETGIRYSADHDDTVPMWHQWVPVAVGVALTWLIPRSREAAPGTADGTAVAATAATGPRRPPLGEALALTAMALAFAVALYAVSAAGAGEPGYILTKALALLVAPLLLFWWLRRGRRGQARSWALWPAPARNRAAPAVPVLAWALLTYVGPFAKPPSGFGSTVDPVTLVAVLAVGFLLNAVLEEVFYRRWLQSRWEAVLGAWPAIVLASLLWASWHVAIQGRGDLAPDLAAVFVNQGVTGLFLGFLWSRYRRMWPLLVVHGLVNSGTILIGLL